MRAPKITSGDWKAQRGGVFVDGEYSDMGGRKLLSAYVADTLSFPLGPDQCKANARLIAAAPDLAKALNALWELIEDQTLVRNISSDSEPDFAVRQIRLVQRLQQAGAALFKAGYTEEEPA